MGYRPENRTPSVFLSYRREDAGAFAVSLGDRLKADLRLENVFVDVRDVFGGDDWRRVIADRLTRSDVVVALIGAHWSGPRPDGTSRIFDVDDVVRWELERVLGTRPADVVPTMLDGARLPPVLPATLHPLYRAQRLDLLTGDPAPGYHELLADVFMRTHFSRGRPVLITDGSNHAEAYLDRLAYELKAGRFGAEAVVAVTAVTRGFAAVTLREASERWPDVIVMRHPGADEEKLAALLRGVRRTTGRVAVAAALGGAAGVSFAIGQSLVGPALVAPPPPPFPAEAPAYGGRIAREAVGRRRGLGVGAKIGLPVAAALTAAVVAWSAIPRPPPPELAGTWQVDDFVLSQNGDVSSTVNLAGGRMVFRPEFGCSGELCPLVVSAGPPLLLNVVMRPQGGGRYVGAPVNITRSCGGAEIPPDRTRTSLTATRGQGGDFLFVITVETPEGWNSCPPATTRYQATARRAPP